MSCDCRECLECFQYAVKRYGKHDMTCASVALYTPEGAWDRADGGTGKPCSCGLDVYLGRAPRDIPPDEHAPWCAVTKMLRHETLAMRFGKPLRIGGSGSCHGTVCDCGRTARRIGDP